jgi:hypothetical protein
VQHSTANLSSTPLPVAKPRIVFDDVLRQHNISVESFRAALESLGVPKGETEADSSLDRMAWLIKHRMASQRERVQIGCNYSTHPRWKFLAGVPLIYIPILVGVIPMMICAALVRTHLKWVGGHNLKSYWGDFVPKWVSHRYTRQTQIIPVRAGERFGWFMLFAKSKIFWIFNCKLYCPLSIALLSYVLYLVKIVEQWWCPFRHEKKPSYAGVPIDQSFWHATGDSSLMHPEDRENPSWSPTDPKREE